MDGTWTRKNTKMNVNDWIAVKITAFVGSMWCAYLFAAFAIWGAPDGIRTLGFQNWFAEEFLQLVLLSVIMVGQNVQAKQITDLHEKHDIIHHHLFGHHTESNDNGV